MSIEVEELNGTNCKTYLLTSGKEAILVDPVREHVASYRALLAARGLQLRLLLDTHMHADHLMLGRADIEAFAVPVAHHRSSPSPLVTRHLTDGERIPLGDGVIEVLHTPGHTPDSVSYRVPGAVLTGDTLLIGGSGRTDFPGSDAGAQFDAVTGRLFAMPDETVVWPGHDYKGRTSSTIGVEKQENARFLGRTRAAYIELMGSLGLAMPDKIQQALQVNQSGFEASEVVFPSVTAAARIEELSPTGLAGLLAGAAPPVVLDVREPEEFVSELGHIEGALLVPMDALERRLPKLAGYVDRDLVVVCRAGARSASAGAMLERAGFRRVKNLAGGMLAWTQAGLRTSR